MENMIYRSGMSVRLSPKSNKEENVYLPSIHYCTDLEKIRDFISTYENKYNIIIHESVRPEKIGSISKLKWENASKLILETYTDFDARKAEKIENRMVIPFAGEKLDVHELSIEKLDKKDYRDFLKVVGYIKDLPFSTYDMEYVLQDKKVIFTDLTINNKNEFQFAKQFLKRQRERKQRSRKEEEISMQEEAER